MKKKRPDRGNFKVLTSTKSEAFLKRKSKKPTKKSVKMLAKKVKLGKEGKSPGNAPEKIIQKKAAKRAKITKRVKKSGRAKAIKRAEGASKNKKIIKINKIKKSRKSKKNKRNKSIFSKTTKKRKREKKSFLKKSKKKRTSSAQKKSRAAVKRLRKINQDRKKRKLVYRIEKSQKKKKKIKTVKKLRKLRKTKKLKNLKGTKRKKRKKAMPGKVKKSRSTKVTIRFRRKKNQFCISKRKFLYALLFFLLVLSFSVLSLLHYLNVFDLWYTLELFGKVVSSTVKNLSTSVRSFTLIGSFTLVRSFLSEHFLTNLYFFIVVVIGITYSILRRRYRQGKLQQRKKARVFDHKTAVSKISVEIKSGETQIDALYRIIKEKGKLSEEDALRIFKVSKEVINEWVSVLESHDLIAVAYPAFGSPVLKIAEIEKKREEGELNE